MMGDVVFIDMMMGIAQVPSELIVFIMLGPMMGVVFIDMIMGKHKFRLS